MQSVEQMVALMSLATVCTLSPGPNNLMMMASGTNFGFRRTLPHISGVLVGFQVLLMVVGIGLLQVLLANRSIYYVLKVVCIGYLIYLAIRMATANSSLDTEEDRSSPLTFTQAALFQWVNPKVWTVIVATTGIFVSESAPVGSFLVISLVFFVTGIVSTLSWTYAGTRLRRLLQTPFRLRVFNITAALLLLTSLFPIVTEGR